jgi:hypothetical protein
MCCPMREPTHYLILSFYIQLYMTPNLYVQKKEIKPQR